MKNLILKIGIILIIGLLICTGYVQATVTNGYTFGISPERIDETGDKYIYTFQSSTNLKYIWNVQQYNNGIADTNKIFYCLAQGYGDFGNFDATAIVGQRPNATGGTSASSYSGPYRLKDSGVLDTLKSIYNNNEKVLAFNEDRINGLLWILDNMYMPGEDKQNFLNKIPCTDDGSINIEDYTVAEAMEETTSTEDDLSDIDIEIAQQLAIWQITNEIGLKGMPTIYLSKNGSELKTYDNIFTGLDIDKDIVYGELRQYYVKMVYNYLVKGAQKAQNEKYKGDNITTISVYANAAAQPVVTITREKELVGKYNVQIKKVDTKGNTLPGATFTVNNKDYITGADGIAKIASDIEITKDNVNDEDLYSIVEKVAPNGYKKYNETITAKVTKTVASDDSSYILDKVTIDDKSNSSGKVSIDKTTNTITITVVDEEISGKYTVKINKQNQQGVVLQDAIFTVDGKNYTTDSDGYATIASDVSITKNNVTTQDIYTITEIKAPEGYVVYDGTIELKVTKKLSDNGEQYEIDKATLDETSIASGKIRIEINGNTITVIVIEDNIDLSLRKFISKVVDLEGKRVYSDKELENRIPDVDTTNLRNGKSTTAEYNHSKEPVKVSTGDKVTYTLRVYNEGQSDAYITEITDYLSKYLKSKQDKEWTVKYKENEQDKYETKATTTTETIITGASDNLSNLIGNKIGDGILLPAYNKQTDKLSYIDVQITCEVLEPDINIEEYKITNIAEITGILDREKNPVNKDIDSTSKDVKLPDNEQEWEQYKDNEIGKKDYIPGQQDDDDFEKLIIKGKFDLALRKFITKVNTIDVNNRYPSLSKDTNGNIKYTHTKTPLEVCTGDTVIYTIRVYNEGEIAGYANEITDNVPYGLEYIKDNEINKEYRWKMLDENEKETEDISKAKYLVTDYLSEEQEKETGRNNLIKPLDKKADLSNTNPDYRDVQIAFKVTYEVKQVGEESRILVNVAQISEDSNDDIDSVPNRDEEYDENNHEDDIDYENVKVKYFDLSLLKWVTKAIVVENGKTTITESGHTGYENPEPDLKVEIKTKDVNKVSIKFAYKIKITNEGEIAGYAKEITDYIPEGLEFKQEDNPDWYVRGDGKVATALLENVLLQPGESAEVEIILTWINGEKNLGRKVNVAEISKDDNPSKTPDIDSTPDNQVPGEDDIDDAPVLLVIKTGTGINVQYMGLAIAVITILGTGIVAIKKFVLI